MSPNEYVRVRIDKTFKKGTEPNYSNQVYKVVSVQGKSVTLDNGDIKKRSTLLKVPEGSVSKKENVIDQVNRRRRQKRLMNKEGVETSNIINTNRRPRRINRTKQ